MAWGRKATLLKQQGYLKVWTVEDGFVRSIGLGAKLIRPFSLVVDDIGIYYDATQPSRLEILLNSAHLTDRQRERALQLQQVLVREQLTKYNVGSQQLLKREWMTKTQQRKILVVGQVEDDLSVQLGGVGIKTNLDLLSTVRKSHSDAVIIYKPHPDVEANLRKGKLDSTLVLNMQMQLKPKAIFYNCLNISMKSILLVHYPDLKHCSEIFRFIVMDYHFMQVGD